MCPLFIGMQIRLSQNVLRPLLVREVRGMIRNIQFHPTEDRYWERPGAPLDPITLRFLPTAVIIELDDQELQEVRFAQDLAPGYVMLGPQECTWDWTRHVDTQSAEGEQNRSKKISTHLLRRQVPLARKK